MLGRCAFGLLVLFGAMSGCTRLHYACSDNAQCGAEGRCEVDGWCSFPDENCPSGRRYAEFSGDGLGNACVDMAADASSSGGSGTTHAPDATTTLTTTSGVEPESSTTMAPEASSGTSCGTDCDDSTTSSTSDALTSGGSEDSTGSPPEPCVGFFDDFDDGAFDSAWELYAGIGMSGHLMEEVDGRLRWTFAEDVIDQRGLQQILGYPFGRVRVHVGEVPATPGVEAQLVLSVRAFEGEAAFYMVWANDELGIRIGDATVATVQDAMWVDVERSADGMVTISTSPDGVDFETQASVASELPEDGVWIVLYGQTWTEAPVPSTGGFESIEICEP